MRFLPSFEIYPALHISKFKLTLFQINFPEAAIHNKSRKNLAHHKKKYIFKSTKTQGL